MKVYTVLLFFSLSLSCFAQINYEKGYFITNENQKVECFIKNNDWLKNPSEFNYKLSEEGDVKTAGIKDVKEFSIGNIAKFIRANVDIDTSSSLLKDLSHVRIPLWAHKQLFLKVLVEGKASLYDYYSKNNERFFYTCKDSVIKQLIYKEFYIGDDSTAFNYTFRQQLLNEMTCALSGSPIRLSYEKKDLTKYFQKYNECVDPTYVRTVTRQKRDLFNLYLNTGFNYASFSMKNSQTTILNMDYDPKMSARFGIGLEYILPFNKNTWGINLESSYRTVKFQNESNYTTEWIDYRSVEISVGLKHYYYFNPNAKLYIDGYYNSIANPALKSYSGYHLKTSYMQIDQNFGFKDWPHTSFGLGFEFMRLNVEVRYYTNNDLLRLYSQWKADYRRWSFLIGYNLLKLKSK